MDDSVEQAWVTAVQEDGGQPAETFEQDAGTPQVPTQTELVAQIVEQIKPLLDQQKAEFAEQLRRTQQSARDTARAIEQKIEQRLAQANIGLEAAVEDGRLTEEDAEAIRENLRAQFAREATIVEEQPDVPSWVADTQAQLDKIWAESGLVPEDPEAQMYLPKELGHLPPFQAVQAFQNAVNIAKTVKAQRLGSTGNSIPPVFVDMGTGTSVSNANIDMVIAALQAELDKPNSDDAKILALGKQLEQLMAQPRG